MLDADVAQAGIGREVLVDDPDAPVHAVRPPDEPQTADADPDLDDGACGEPAPDAKAAWDLVTLSYSDPEALAGRLAGYGSAVVALSPPEVRNAVIRHLSRIAAGIPIPRRPGGSDDSGRAEPPRSTKGLGGGASDGPRTAAAGDADGPQSAVADDVDGPPWEPSAIMAAGSRKESGR
ncbi:hypothetical protein [Cryptosporangium minutisporangium]